MKVDISKFKTGKVHFIGCGGAGMFPLAIILIELGYKVSGSDMRSSLNVTLLQKRGAKVSAGHAQENVPRDDNTLIVFSSAISEDNPELQLARDRGLVCLRRGEMLGCLSSLYKRVVAVSGSHGKTTVTAMLAHIMDVCDIPAGYMIGGKVVDKEMPARAGNGDIFITEVDESDGTHAAIHCSIGLVTNVECDHSWSVGGEERLYGNFCRFSQQCDSLVYMQSEKSNELFSEHKNRDILVTSEVADKFSFKYLEPARLAEWGEYQRANAALAINAAVKLGVKEGDAERALSSFNGVARRMTLHLKTDSVILIEDYAHHPTEVRVALESLRERFPSSHITIVFQPHRYARLERYLDEFATELRKADAVVVVPVFAAWVEKGSVNSDDLSELIGAKSVSLSEDWDYIAKDVVDGVGIKADCGGGCYKSEAPMRVIAVFGAGTVNEIIPFLKELL